MTKEESCDGQTFYRATLSNAVISRLATTDANKSEVLMNFPRVTISVRQQNPDGTFGQPQVGTLDCTK